MKKLLLLPLIVLCFLPELKSQNWIELDIPSGVYPNALDFINPNEGWVIDDYSLMHTNDGGLTWNLQEVPTEYLMNSVCFISETHGWIAADNGSVYHTTDGGGTWELQQTSTPYPLKKIIFIDELHGWTIGLGPGIVGTFFYTIDGGQNWLSTECPCLFNDLDFYSATQGWMVCDNGQTYSTYDGGETIEALNLNNNFTLKNIDFVNDGIGWRVGENNLLQQTLNGGLGWYDEVSPLDVFVLDGLSFSSSTVGAVSGYSSIAVTIDGGDSWSVTQIPNSFIRDVEMIDEFSGYATTVNGVIKYCGIGILTQPESTVVTEGSPVQLNAQSTLFGASYQWQAFILGEWVNLQDNSAYNGTNNNVLSIAAAYGNMTFRCVISFQGCSVTTNEVTVQTTVGVDETPSLYLTIFPNPAMENLTVEIPNELIGEDVIIYDVTGREIYRSKTTNTINLITTAALSSGSYVLRVGDLSVKVVK